MANGRLGEGNTGRRPFRKYLITGVSTLVNVLRGRLVIALLGVVAIALSIGFFFCKGCDVTSKKAVEYSQECRHLADQHAGGGGVDAGAAVAKGTETRETHKSSSEAAVATRCGWCTYLLEPNGHREGPTTLWQALTQIFTDFILASLWFLTFLRRDKRDKEKPTWKYRLKTLGAILLCGVPPTLYALAMRDLYNPAVFFMGFVAVFMAAEHFGSLTGAVTGITEGANTLEVQNKDIKKLLDDITRESQTLEAQNKDIKKLLDEYGLSAHRQKMFALYRFAESRIDAVLRVVDIDVQWWELVKAGRSDTWSDYFNLEPPPLPGYEGLTLFQALIPPTDTNRKLVVRTDKVQFVCQMPFALSQAGEGDWREEDFENLLGLAWRLVVLHEVRKRRIKAWQTETANEPGKANGGRFQYVRMKVTNCPSWIHAIDDKVYQVQADSRGLQYSRVRQLTEDEPATDPTAQRTERTRLNGDLVGWAHEEIRRYARNGASGEDYVCAILRFVCLTRNTLDPGQKIASSNPSGLKMVLEPLNYNKWLTWRTDRREDQDNGARGLPPIDQKTAEDGCQLIFRKFLSIVVNRDEARFEDLLVSAADLTQGIL